MFFSYRICILLLLALSYTGFCQSDDLVFEEIYLKDNYSFGIVEDFYQDQHGFIWIGAKDGLFRYDGVEYKAYYFSQDDPNSISNNVVRKIFGDSEGKMWVATENGLNCYIEEKDYFIRYLHDYDDSTTISSNFVREIVEDKGGNLWFATINGGLCLYDRKKDHFIRYNQDSPSERRLSSDNLRTVFNDSEDILWIGTSDKGVIFFRPGEKEMHALLPGPKDGKSLYGQDVRCIIEDQDGKIWFGTNGNGISCYNKKTKKFSYYSNDPMNSSSLGSDIIWSFSIDSKQNLWICTDNGGLNRYLPVSDSFKQYKHDLLDQNSISSNVVRVLFEDNAQNFWIGNFNAPINYVNNFKKKFYNIRNNIHSSNSLNNNKVTSVLVDSEGLIWIGTDGGGLNVYNQESKEFKHYLHDPGNRFSIPNNKPMCLTEDNEGNIWIGHFEGGLSCLNKDSRKFIHYFPDGSDLTPRGKQIWDILLDGEKLWLASEMGVDILHLETRKFTHLPVGMELNNGTSTSSIWSIEKDSKGRVLIGTIDGLNVYDEITESFEYYRPDLNNPKSISDRWILDIYEDGKNRIWIGTNGGGLNLWKENEEAFECFDIHDGLPGNVINAILEDSQGNLWLSTNNGFSKFNYDDNSITNFDANDGIQGNRFNINSSFLDKDGTMYFGGINGLTCFDPLSIKENFYIPNIVFTGFDIFNKEVNIHDPDSPIKENINDLEEIKLLFKHRVFTIHFAALNFTQPEENNYQYILENFEESWNDVGHQTSATYTNLMPGKYKFRVIASNNDKIWNTEGRSINIIVHPPYYRTWWFISLALAGVILLVIALYRYRIRQISLMNIKLTSLVQERTRELEEHSQEIEKQNQEIAEQRDMATLQRDQIQKQNEELEYHRNNLTLLVKEQTNELNHAKNKAEESDRLKTAFLENISHEIRTPLNAILGFINLLIEKKDDQKSRDYYLRIINESGKSMLRLVQDIIDFSRIQIGELKPVYGECNLNELIKELVSTNREKISREKPKLSILAELPKEEAIAITDEQKLNQILSKLIENSIKFTEEGHITIGIHKYNNSHITFIVEDTGIGIDPQHTDKIFDRFFKVQDDNSDKLYRGSGLGLAFAKVVTELMGGKIWVESQLKKGSKFFFTIPHIKPENKEIQTPVSIEKNYVWNGKKILIAEDQESNYLLIEAFLKNTGVILLRAKDGVELLELFEKETDVDMIFLDLKMPRMDGIHAMKIIRESNKTVPVIAQTAYDRTYHKEKCLEMGCNEYFVKPIRKKEMLEIVTKYLG